MDAGVCDCDNLLTTSVFSFGESCDEEFDGICRQDFHGDVTVSWEGVLCFQRHSMSFQRALWDFEGRFSLALIRC